MSLGVPAAKKLKSFDALSEQAAWPAKVKLDFRRVADQHSTTEAPEDQATTAVWFPADEPLSTLVKRVQPRTHDFSLTYRDADRELVLLPPTTSGVRDFASVEGGGKRLTVEWRAPSVRPWPWLVGMGVDPDEVEDARHEVERAGGIVMADNHHSSLVHCSDCEESKWPELCGKLAEALGLEGELKAELLAIAGTCGGGRVFKSRDRIDVVRSTITTRTLAYETTCGEGKITVACGFQVLSMKYQEECVNHVPVANCVRLETRVFSVVPQATPGPGENCSTPAGWYDIPEGWKIVDASGNDFAEVLRVIVGHAWSFEIGVGAILVRKEGHLSGYYVGSCKMAGNLWKADAADYLEVAADGNRCRIKNTSNFFPNFFLKVLIERDLGGPRNDVATAWGTYVELRARVEWERRLYAPQRGNL